MTEPQREEGRSSDRRATIIEMPVIGSETGTGIAA
jgi:hypothetical protein